jgi:DNA polymerase
VIRSADAVIQFLEAEQARGVSHVYLDEGARDGLRALFRRSKPKPRNRLMPATPPAPQAPATPSATLTVTGGSKSECLASLRQQALTWSPARNLGTLREPMVFASGNPDARIMLVGGAPGYDDEKSGQPFVGTAGQKLDDMLRAMGLSRDEVYLSLILKFRPASPRQTTNNRKPSPAEVDACMPFIRAEISIVRPECIIALGTTAAESLLGLSGNISNMRGVWHQFDDIPMRVTHHPSYLLQSTTNLASKRLVWEDMLMVMEQLIMPISPRQRAFFLPKS